MYFYCEEYEGSYLIFMTEKFYNYTKPYFQQHSFYNIFPSLFNLSKEDFYKYVETTFGAKIISGKYIIKNVYLIYEICEVKTVNGTKNREIFKEMER